MAPDEKDGKASTDPNFDVDGQADVTPGSRYLETAATKQSQLV